MPLSLSMRSLRIRRAVALSSVVLATGGLILAKAPASALPLQGGFTTPPPAPLVANGTTSVAFSGPGAHGTFALSHTKVLAGQTTPVYAEVRLVAEPEVLDDRDLGLRRHWAAPWGLSAGGER